MTTSQKIIVVSDIHYGLGRNSKTKLSIIKDFVEPAIEGELTEGSTLVICGDLFHEMVSVRTDIYKEARSFIERCASRAQVFILAGNHDCYEDSTDITSIELFDQLDNVLVIRTPTEKTLSDGRRYLFLPWSDDNAWASKFDDGAYDAVFCHPDVPREFFSGLYLLENGKRHSATRKNRARIADDDLISTGLDGMDFSDGTENNRALHGLDSVRKVITLAKEGGTIFAGHIHKHSESSILGRKFFFVGSPYQTTTEEMNSKSGYYVITKTETVFREIHAPEFVKVRFSDVKRDGVEKYDFKRVRGNIVQFDADAVVSVELEAALRKAVMAAGPFDVADTDYSNLVVESQNVDNPDKYQRAFSSSPRRCVEMYIDSMDDAVFAEEKVSRGKIKNMFAALYDLMERKIGVVESDGGASIEYKRMVATNFLSYDTLEFDFQRYGGLTLVYGRNLDNPGATNACGKSNIIKAIVYSLFGRFPKKVKKENMSQWESPSSDVDVTIYLKSNGTNYRIESGIAKKSRDAYHRVFDEDRNVDLTKKQLAETRKFIETEILHCGFDMFMKTTVLTSSEIFNFYCMEKKDKDDYLNTIFGTKALNEVREQIKGYLKESRAVYMEQCRLLESKEHDIELNRTASERFEANRAESVENMRREISSLEARIDELAKTAVVEDANKANELESEVELVESRIRELNREVSKTKDSASAARAAVEKDTATIKIMTKELSKHKDIVPRLCEKCKTIAAEGYNLMEYAKSISKSKASLAKNSEKYTELTRKIGEVESERDSLVEKSMGLTRKIRGLRSGSTEISRVEAAIQSKRSSIDYISSQENPNIRIIESLEADRDELKVRADEILARIQCLDFIQTKVVSQDVIINLLTSKFVTQLNERIRYYLQRLGLNLGVEFDNDFHYEFVRGNGAHPEFNSLSGGESLRIVIATSFAFKDFLESRRNISSNIRFLDEFFEKDTDNLGMNSTISILKDFSRIMKQNVFLISNKLREIDDGMFDNVLVVNIENSRSFITEESVGGR